MTENEKKKGIRERIADFISPKKPPGYMQKELHGLGLDVLSDYKLENRIRAMYEFQQEFEQPIETESLEGYIAELQRRTQLLHDVLTLIAMPYATSGNYPIYQKKYSAWLTFYSSAKSLLLHAEEEIKPLEVDDDKKNEEEKEIMMELRQIGAMEHTMLVRFIHEALQRHYWREGFNFMNQCFRDKHVSASAVTVVQNVQQKKFIPVGQETPAGQN